MGLDRFHDTAKGAELDDLSEVSPYHATTDCARGLNSTKTPSPPSRRGPEGLAVRKANATRKFHRDGTGLVQKEEEELLSRIIADPEDGKAHIDNLVGFCTILRLDVAMSR